MLFFHTWGRRLIYPFWLLGMLWRLLLSKGSRACGSGRVGAPPVGEPHGLWFHAETPAAVQTAAPLVYQLMEGRREGRITFTTGGPEALAMVRALFADAEVVDVTCAPLDLAGPAGRFIRRLQPRLLVLVETPTRPNLVRKARRRGVPVLLLNAIGLPRRGRCERRILKWLDGVTAVNDQVAEAYRAVVPDPEGVSTTGDIRFDAPTPGGTHHKQAGELREAWGDKRPVWLALDVEPKEAGIVRDTFAGLRGNHPNLLLVLVPAGAGQGHGVAAPFEDQGYKVVRHGGGDQAKLDTDVYVIDSARDRPLACVLGDVAFVGGTLTGNGHNPAPVAAAGRPMVTGPNLNNVSAVAVALHSVHALVVVGGPRYLADGVEKLLADRDQAAQLGAAGQQLVTPHAGAMRQALETLSWLAREADE
ncbi:MAG: 3-deoxy-D-manno-octulosonic acid transferase [Pseudomonadota bacterium]